MATLSSNLASNSAPLLILDAAGGPKRFPVLETLVALEMAAQIVLLFGAPPSARPFIRIIPFGLSAALALFAWKQPTVRHPSAGAAQAILIILALSFLNPGTAGAAPGLAEFFIHFCVLAPLFWTNRLGITGSQLRRVFIMLWMFHSISAGLGVLQVRYPGQLQPNVSSIITSDADYADSLKISNAQGERVFRPMGLTDVPGGAGISGFYAALLGAALLLRPGRPLLRAVASASVLVGLACVYMCQVRSVLVMLIVALLAVAAILVLRGDAGKTVLLLASCALVGLLGFFVATSIAGKSVTNRLSTLVDSDVNDVYYQNRGHFLQDTIDKDLGNYPLGAGLGRWGMMNAYFADDTDPARPVLWAEIQWTGWLYDGGVPLVIAYVVAIGIAIAVAWRVALYSTDGDLWIWGAVVLAYNIAALALTFDYPFFNSQGGMELWMLNGALLAATKNRELIPALLVETWE